MWNFIAGLNVSKPLDNNIIWYCYHLCDEIKCLYLVAVTILTILKVHFFGVGVQKNFAPSSFFACYGTDGRLHTNSKTYLWSHVREVRVKKNSVNESSLFKLLFAQVQFVYIGFLLCDQNFWFLLLSTLKPE